MPLHVVSGTRSQVYLCYIILHPALCRRQEGWCVMFSVDGEDVSLGETMFHPQETKDA
jgi:hypothetical protein